MKSKKKFKSKNLLYELMKKRQKVITKKILQAQISLPLRFFTRTTPPRFCVFYVHISCVRSIYAILLVRTA